MFGEKWQEDVEDISSEIYEMLDSLVDRNCGVTLNPTPMRIAQISSILVGILSTHIKMHIKKESRGHYLELIHNSMVKQLVEESRKPQ